MEPQILKPEKECRQAMESRNVETVKALRRFPCIVAGKNGVPEVDEPSFKKYSIPSNPGK